LIAVDASGMNSIIVVAGANASLHALSAAELGAVRDSAVVLAQLEIPPDTVRAAFEAAHEGRGRAGRPPGFTILNAAPARPVDRSLLAATDLLVVNETEAATLTGSQADDGWSLCARLLESAPRVVVTVGAEGVLFADRGGTRQHVPAAPARPVDTTAAGDTFAGVLAAAIAAGRPAVTALRLACAAASVTVEKAGAIPSIPTAAQTAERYQAAYTRGRPAGHDDGEAGDGR
jgi:ribokinase